jgi:hypothetical protein
MDVWNSPPSVGLDKRKEYVVSKMKEGYELLVSPRRVRLFKRGVGYIPCAVQIFRKLEHENLLNFVGEDEDEKIYKLNSTVKIRVEKAKPKKTYIEEDDTILGLDDAIVLPELDTTISDLAESINDDDDLDDDLDEDLEELDLDNDGFVEVDLEEDDLDEGLIEDDIEDDLDEDDM